MMNLFSELNSKYTSKISIETSHCTYFSTGKKAVEQEHYICLDCFPNEKMGACLWCISNCHKDHKTKFIGHSDFFCTCAMLTHSFSDQKEKVSQSQCVCYPIDSKFLDNFYSCRQCQKEICSYCAKICHFEHLSEEEKAKISMKKEEKKSNIKELQRMKTKEYIEFSEKVCQCSSHELHSTNKIRTHILDIAATITKEFTYLNEVYFNFLFENPEIYNNVISQMNLHMKSLEKYFENTGEALLTVEYKYLDLVFLEDSFRLLALLNSAPKRFVQLADNFNSIFNWKFFTNLFPNFPNIRKKIDSNSKIVFDELRENMLIAFLVNIKSQLAGLPRMETKTIENLTPFERLGIQQCCQSYVEGKPQFILIETFTIHVIKNLEAFHPTIRVTVTNFSLSLIKILLKTRIFKNQKKFITQILESICVELQKNVNLSEIIADINDKTLVLCSDILLLAYFHLRDIEFSEQLKNFNPNTDFILSNTPQNTTIYIIVFSVILNLISTDRYFPYKNGKNFTKFTNNIQRLLRENCFSDNLYSKGLAKCSFESYKSYLFLSSPKENDSELKIFSQEAGNISEALKLIVLSKTYTGEQQLIGLIDKIIDSLDVILKKCEEVFEGILLDKGINELLIDKCQKHFGRIRRLQDCLKVSGCDISMIRLVRIYPILMLDSKFIKKFSNIPHMLLQKCLQVLFFYSFGNIDNTAVILGKNNLDIFYSTISETNTFIEFSEFYHNIISAVYFKNKKYVDLAQTSFIVDHLSELLTLALHQENKNTMEIDSMEYLILLHTIDNILESFSKLIKRTHNQQEDYFNHKSITFGIFNYNIVNFELIFKELFFVSNENTNFYAPIEEIEKQQKKSIWRQWVEKKKTTVISNEEFTTSPLKRHSIVLGKIPNIQSNRLDLCSCFNYIYEKLNKKYSGKNGIYTIEDLYILFDEQDPESEKIKISVEFLKLLLSLFKLINMLVENNETLFMKNTVHSLSFLFTDTNGFEIKKEVFGKLQEVYRSAYGFIDLQAQISRFLYLNWMNYKRILFSLEQKHLDSEYLIKNIFEVMFIMQRLISVKNNITTMKDLILHNVEHFPHILTLFKEKYDSRNDDPDAQNLLLSKLKQYLQHAIFLPFEMIVNFVKKVSDTAFVNGNELFLFKKLIYEMVRIKDLFLEVMSDKIPENIESRINSPETIEELANLEKISYINFDEVYNYYESIIIKSDYLSLFDSIKIKTNYIEEVLNNLSDNKDCIEEEQNYNKFYTALLQNLLEISENEELFIEKTPLFHVLTSDIKPKNFCNMKQLFLQHAIENIVHPWVKYPFSKHSDLSYYNFNTSKNYQKLFLRLLVKDTKPMQSEIAAFIESDASNKKTFRSILLHIISQMPSFFNLIKYCNPKLEDHNIATVSDICVDYMQFFRFLAEQQNYTLQRFLGDNLLIEKFIGLFEILVKSNQMESISDPRSSSFIVSDNFFKLLQYTLIMVSEMHLGPCLENQQISMDLLQKQKFWPILVKILSEKTEYERIFELRAYIIDLILSLLEGNNAEIMETIMSTVNYKMWEDCLLIAFKNLVETSIGKKIDNYTERELDLFEISEKLIIMYKEDNTIDESNEYVKILSNVYRILHIYTIKNKEVYSYLNSYEKKIKDPEAFKEMHSGVIASAFHFLYNIIGSIEYIDSKDEINTYLYLIPPVCFYLSNETKYNFLEVADRENSSTKFTSLQETIPNFLIEMEENKNNFKESKFIRFCFKKNVKLHRLELINDFIAILINILIIYNYGYNSESEIVRENAFGIYALAIFNVLFAIFSLVSLCLIRWQIHYRISLREYEQMNKNPEDPEELQISNLTKLKFKILDSFIYNIEFLPIILHIILSVLGLMYSEVFFALELFCLIFVSDTMFSVLKALNLRKKQFSWIFVLIVLIINLYAFFGFFGFSESFADNVVDAEGEEKNEKLCDTLVHCVISMLYLSLTTGGTNDFVSRVSYTNQKMYLYRILYDLSFFILITLIMLNIINGIIIDTFANLRDEEASKEHSKKNICYICDLERWRFEKSGVDFDLHTQKRHNIWNYANFLVYIKLLDPDNAIGIETYIMDKISGKDLSWVPMEKCFDLE